VRKRGIDVSVAGSEPLGLRETDLGGTIQHAFGI
jgi:hypothetical protein